MIAYSAGSDSMLRSELDRQLRRELAPRERLLWAGQPRRGLMLRPSDGFLIPFSLFWCGFAIFWEWQVVSREAPFFFRLWGLPFVLIGLYLVFGRFFVDALQRARTYYGLTDSRIMIVSGLINRTTKSFALETLPELALTEGRGDEGTISFGLGSLMSGGWRRANWSVGGSWPGMNQNALPQFERIPRAREVYELIRATQKKARQAEDAASG